MLTIGIDPGLTGGLWAQRRERVAVKLISTPKKEIPND